ncbi:MAG: hypothetical protein M0C28_40155 [Candidatus Moduliflexus flocculans]|nr:hypothetical protein [Candidatus Moduliflexus flocculans]
MISGNFRLVRGVSGVRAEARRFHDRRRQVRGRARRGSARALLHRSPGPPWPPIPRPSV